MDNVVRDGVIMLTLLAVIIICYIVLSTPFDSMVSGFEDVNMTASDAKVEESSAWIRVVWEIFFAGLGSIPIIWFIMRMFQRETEWRY